jgi:hypothetical protein
MTNPAGAFEDFYVYYSQQVNSTMSKIEGELDITLNPANTYDGSGYLYSSAQSYMVYVHKTLTPNISGGSAGFRLLSTAVNTTYTGIYLAGYNEGGSGDYVDGIFMGVSSFYNTNITLQASSLNSAGSGHENIGTQIIGAPPTPDDYYYIECTWAENAPNVDITVKLYDKTYTTQYGSTLSHSIPSTEWRTDTAGFLCSYPRFLDTVKIWV